MKNKVLTIMTAIALFMTLAAGSSYAQGADVLKVNVPFDFAISSKKLAAGEYYLRRSVEGFRVVLQIRSKDNSQSVYLSTTLTVKMLGTQGDSKLVFNRYGDQFFLSQVWMAGRTDGQELIKTRRERLLQREIARGSGKPETISIAAHFR